MKPVALLIGFGPFPGAPVNPSATLVRSLGRLRRPAFADARIVTHVLPTNYEAVEHELPELIQKQKPDIVLMFGLAGRAKTVRIESQGINASSSLHPDASGKNPLVRALIPKAPRRLKSAAPLSALITAAKSASVNTNLSHNAGRYICNASLFTCLDLRRWSGNPRFVAFVHIPWPRKPLHSGKGLNRRRPTAEMLLRAGANILACLIAAARRG